MSDSSQELYSQRITRRIVNPSTGRQIFCYSASGMCSIELSGSNKCLFIDFDKGNAFIGKKVKTQNISH